MGVCILVSGAMLYCIPCIQKQSRLPTQDEIAMGKSPVNKHVTALIDTEVITEIVS